MATTDQTEWLQRFADKLHSLRPDLSPQTAAMIAGLEWDNASGTEPEQAAEDYALE